MDQATDQAPRAAEGAPEAKRRKHGEPTATEPQDGSPAGASAASEARTTAMIADGLDERKVQLAEAFKKAQPFPHVALDAFLGREEDVQKLAEEAARETFYQKDNDLFTFAQTGDLAGRGESALPRFVRELYSDSFLEFLTAVTGVEGLDGKIDLTSSVYSETHNLLCHDDELSSRRIAFILYLVPEDWEAADGGTLDLFTVDKDMQPNGIFKRLVPRRNSLVLFEVSGRSYHQVAEVLSKDKQRHSIGGWFHGPKAVTAADWEPLEPTIGAVQLLPELPMCAPRSEPALDLAKWVNPVYLGEDAQAEIRKMFEAESSAQLQGFLKPDFLAAVRAALKDDGAAAARWTAVGPYQKRRFDALLPGTGEMPAALQELIDLFASEALATLVARLTTLTVTSTRGLLRRFTQGCYTMAHDRDAQQKQADKNQLDLLWTDVSDAEAWVEAEAGGELVYLAENEEEPLAVSPATPNTLSLFYRADGEVASFVKYVNRLADGPRFDFAAVCALKEDDDGDGDGDGEKEGEDAK